MKDSDPEIFAFFLQVLHRQITGCTPTPGALSSALPNRWRRCVAVTMFPYLTPTSTEMLTPAQIHHVEHTAGH